MQLALSNGEPARSVYEYAAAGAPSAIDDGNLIHRLWAAYKLSTKEFTGHGASFWGAFEAKHEDIQGALSSGNLDELARLLRAPAETELFWGFDDLVKSFVEVRNSNPAARQSGAETIYRRLVRAAIGMGAIRCDYPESGKTMPDIQVEDLLSHIEDRIGFRVEFPNPFEFEFGLSTSRGIISDRAVQSLYQAWRVKQICDLVGGRKILEIGAGLGRNAYFAGLFGISSYTIVDIPRTQLAQGYYLGRVLGADSVSLCGEEDADVRLRSAKWLHESREVFDVVLNADSLTEMDRNHALSYVKFAKRHATAFLSINHEFNETTADELLREAGMAPAYRSPYWTRPGYVEELCLLRSTPRGQRWPKSRRVLKAVFRSYRG